MQRLVPLGHFVVRTPLLGFEELAARVEGVDAASRESVYRKRLDDLLSVPRVREALSLGSPALSGDMDVWRSAPDSGHGLKVERALVKYVSRMIGKPTPLGLMGGYTLGQVGGETRLELEAPGAYLRQSRLSYEYLHQLAGALSRTSELEPELLLFPNTSLYTIAGYIRYVRTTTSHGSRRYEWVALEDNEYLQRALLRAGSGATRQEVAEAIAGEEVDASEAMAFVRELVALELLVPTLAPPLTALNGLERLAEAVARTSSGKPFARRLHSVREALAEIDRVGMSREPAGHGRVMSLLEPLPAPVDPRRLVQVDLLKPGRQVRLGTEVVEELKRGITLLHRIGAFPLPMPLEHFRNAFVQRFGTREVSLLEALDPEFGVTFGPTGGPDDLAGAQREERSSEWHRAMEAREDYWLGRITDALRRGLTELELTDAEIQALPSSAPPPLPSLMTVVAAVAARSKEELAAGHFRIRLDHVNAGGRLLSRAAHLFPELREELRDALSREELASPGAVHAEIVHLPGGAVGDIVAREALHEREIVFLGQPSAPPEHQIPASDLRVSVVGTRIVLRSARLGREVIPRLSNAHDYFGWNLAVYRFLATLQHQDSTSALVFNLGRMRRARFVPRIVSGRLVLSVARWTVWREDLARAAGDEAGGSSEIERLRTTLRLPRFVYLEESEGPLLMDLDNPLSAEILRRAINKEPSTTLTEVFPSPEELSVRDREGRHFNHELYVPFMTAAAAPSRPRALVQAGASRTAPRSHLPGSDWLYIKLYTAPMLLDPVLSRLAPVIARGRESGVIDQWFFVRYADPEWHLRIRFHGTPSRIRSELLPLLEEAAGSLHASGQLWRLQYDTYEQELERYGGPEGMAWAEKVFHRDSEFALAACALSEDGGESSQRWWAALRATHALLVDLGFDLGERWELAKGLKDEALSGMSHELAREVLSHRYRQLRATVQQVLESEDAGGRFDLAILEHLNTRSERLRPQVESARREAAAQNWSIRALAGSCVHMQLNRLLPRDVKAREASIYDFLARYYGSALARKPEERQA
ncbi:lantibiotic dehydratase [Archangium violaceum]|uniref:lantibiotic dehydratase n=1 Tax=Archangium violaceum TaxID=83451 RepID=UPI0019520273|nr:lantibiotic dehydratase [Archangium violaceum]QRN93501.1 lantibiotic dehydratase [Archangium violaceum]